MERGRSQLAAILSPLRGWRVVFPISHGCVVGYGSAAATAANADMLLRPNYVKDVRIN
jgi:hypothetical protein